MLLARKQITDSFHRLFYNASTEGGTWADTRWLGVPLLKSPLDLWAYQEIIVETQPDLLIETGTYDGGSALFFASLFDLLGGGRVVTVDVDEHEARPEHNRITYLSGSSVAPEILERMRTATVEAERVMVVLDSDHRCEHVLAELRAYGPLVSQGCYLVVEDTNVNGHPVLPGFGPGPLEAVERFLAEDKRFEADRLREKFLVSFNACGFLRRRDDV